MDLNNQIQMLENENLEKDKTIDSSQSSLKDLNKQIEYKDFTVDGLIKKNNALEQEKENLFIDYQKKIEELAKLASPDPKILENPIVKNLSVNKASVLKFQEKKSFRSLTAKDREDIVNYYRKKCIDKSIEEINDLIPVLTNSDLEWVKSKLKKMMEK